MAIEIFPTDLPQFLKYEDFDDAQGYFQLQALILTMWFSSNGIYHPTLTNAQVTALLALIPAPLNGLQWLNSDVNAMQFIDSTGVVQTITSA